MAALDHDKHPALVWIWRWGQFCGEDRKSFVALVAQYEDTKQVDPRAALSGPRPGASEPASPASIP